MNNSRALVAVGVPYQAAPDLQRVADRAALRRRTRGPAWVGGGLIAIFVVGFGGWAAVAPLAGGAIAQGVISPDGSRRTVQHLEGGIISTLHIRDGDVVKAGQPLIELEGIQARATHEMLLNQHRTLLAAQARLEAEQAGRDTIELPPELWGAQDRALRAILEGQERLFRTRGEMLAARKRVLRQQIEQSREQIRAYEAQLQSVTTQLALVADELVGKQQLFEDGLLTKPEVRRLERTQAEILGMRGEYLASIARIREEIGGTELQLLTLDAERADEIAGKLDDVRAQLDSVREQLFASADILKRTVVLAPVNGTVVDLRHKTIGGVLGAGEPILDLVPSDDVLQIDARVSPSDIEAVRVGLEAQIHLSAYSSRNLPPIHGVVRQVSADRLVDETTAQAYYLVRVQVDRDELRRIDPRLELVAGMPAEVLIVNGERTMLQYLLQPLRDTFRRSFHEA